MHRVQEMAQAIGENVDYTAEIKTCKQAITRAYFNENTGDFLNGKQGANAFALYLGMGNAKTKENLLAHYKRTKLLDTGIFGTDILCEYLVQIGEIQLLFDLLSASEYPSFGYMKDHSATTLWEWWDASGSHNHPMFGGCVKQLFFGILGLQADVGMKNLRINPKYIEGIGFVRVSLKIGRKTYRFHYEYKNKKVEVKTNF
jgi:alpha-L-rhamnosidase